MATKAIVGQVAKWGPTAAGIAAAAASFLMPSLQAEAKAHPAALGWAILLAVATHLLPSPVKR